MPFVLEVQPPVLSASISPPTAPEESHEEIKSKSQEQKVIVLFLIFLKQFKLCCKKYKVIKRYLF